jgi:hypothetical protein
MRAGVRVGQTFHSFYLLFVRTEAGEVGSLVADGADAIVRADKRRPAAPAERGSDAGISPSARILGSALMFTSAMILPSAMIFGSAAFSMAAIFSIGAVFLYIFFSSIILITFHIFIRCVPAFIAM